MKIKDNLFERRKNIVPNGIGIFNNATAVSAKGSIIKDANGNELIDFAGGIGVLNTGHCPEPVVEAIIKQSKKFIHSCFHVATYELYIELCEKLAILFPHGKNTKVMLTNTGAESVENAIKIARQATKKDAVICFTDAFHGRSMMAMTLTSKIAYKYDCGPFAPEVYRLPFPNYFQSGKGLSFEDFVEKEIDRLKESFLKLVDPNNVAAIIIEVVQGEGGFNPVPEKYLKTLRKICDDYKIVLIVDEVQSGFCRTGKWAAYQHYGITPDISTWAKSLGAGMPIGAVIGKAEIMDAAKPGTIGGTYLGNPVCCAAAIANIKYMEDINLNKKAEEIGIKIRSYFQSLRSKCSSVGDVRGLGAMMAFELVENNNPQNPNAKLCSDLINACLEKGVILLSAGTNKNVIRILSPLTISDKLLEKGLNIIETELLKLTNKKSHIKEFQKT